MTATLAGSFNMGQLCTPVLLGLGPASAQLEANLTAALTLQASVSVVPPSLVAQLEAVVAVETVLAEGIALGLPGITFSVSAAAALVANAQLALSLLAGLQALLFGPNAFVYAYSGGTLSTLGADLSAGLSGSPPPGFVGADPVSGILVGSGTGAWAGIGPYFGGLGL